ncbi:hypothetical protein IQ06DRAFT_144107 [Phaeosphaeriaceae sp. SRC1lsM3a]|nr:hypothetical protein IQ06DRAFT_144107 [Stagonospora sp. SRC1lsM3a]
MFDRHSQQLLGQPSVHRRRHGVVPSLRLRYSLRGACHAGGRQESLRHLDPPADPQGPAPACSHGHIGSSGQAFESQNQEIADAEKAVSTSGGELATAYNAAQVHHGDALADRDRENTGDPSDDQGGGKS